MNYNRQQGAALFVGMIFLLVLTILGLTAAKVSTLDERMAGNYLRREQAYQHAEDAQNEAMRYVSWCADGTCPTAPTSVVLDDNNMAIWNSSGARSQVGGLLASDEEAAQNAIADSSGTEVTGITASMTDHREGVVINTLDLAGGLMGLEAGSTQKADYFRVTSAARKGDLSGSVDARSTDVMRQIIFVP